MPRERRRWLRGIGIAAVVLLVLLGAVRVALEPLVARRTQRTLDGMRGMRGSFSHVQVSVLNLTYSIHDLRIDKVTRAGHHSPFVFVRRLEAGLYWTELLRGHVVGALSLEQAKLDILATAGPSTAEEQHGQKAPSEAPADVGKVLQRFLPFRLDRAEVRDGEIVWVNARVPEKPRIRLQGIEATLENFATRAALARGEPSILAASATLQRTGKVSVFVSADTLAKGLTFAGQARVEGLHLVELAELLAATTGVAPRKGTLDMSARFRAVNGHLTGGVRPILREPGVEQARPGLGDKIKAALADLTLDLLSDRVPGRNAVATTIPLHGDVTDPNAQLWPTVFGVIRNAFVTGLADSLVGLPPGSGEQRREAAGEARRAPGPKRGVPATRER